MLVRGQTAANASANNSRFRSTRKRENKYVKQNMIGRLILIIRLAVNKEGMSTWIAQAVSGARSEKKATGINPIVGYSGRKLSLGADNDPA
ncbi:unnamed protein product, partial [Iphiclides podalirius]